MTADSMAALSVLGVLTLLLTIGEVGYLAVELAVRRWRRRTTLAEHVQRALAMPLPDRVGICPVGDCDALTDRAVAQ